MENLSLNEAVGKDEWRNETFAQAMALFIRYVEETYGGDPVQQAQAYKQMLVDIAEETWGFPNAFGRWRSVNGV